MNEKSNSAKVLTSDEHQNFEENSEVVCTSMILWSNMNF